MDITQLTVGNNLFDHPITIPVSGRVFCVADAYVWSLHGPRCQKALSVKDDHVWRVDQGSLCKTQSQLWSLMDWLLAHDIDRNADLVVAIGGGSVLDMTGLACSLVKRGIPSAYIPTTLLAMVDACVGGKTAINHDLGKNMIGSFYLPSYVWVDVSWLSTLSYTMRLEGFSEMLKHALLIGGDAYASVKSFLSKLKDVPDEQWTLMIETHLAYKQNIIAQDLCDHGKRQWLNLGHTVGHVIEHLFKYSHGHAVAIGLLTELHMSRSIGLSADVYEDVCGLVLKAGYQFNRLYIDQAKWFGCLNQDKKLDLTGKMVGLHGIGMPSWPLMDYQLCDTLTSLKHVASDLNITVDVYDVLPA